MYPMFAFLFAAVCLGWTSISVNATKWYNILIFKALPILAAVWCLFEAAIIFVR